jgi:transcriptional regulator with XRE-family HTH domain
VENKRLRTTMATRGLSAQSLADLASVDPKTVERWVNSGRVPHARTAVLVAEVLEDDPLYLWPSLRQGRKARALSPELIALYEQRADIPPAMWRSFFEKASERIDILVYAANFLHESLPGFNDLLRQKAIAGCHVRVAIGDPRSKNVLARGREERFGHGIESRCELALLHYGPLVGVSRVEIRTHGTTLYNSIYRADDELLVNTHAWGVNAYGAPVWHVRRSDAGTMFATYASSFAAVWEHGKQLRSTDAD